MKPRNKSEQAPSRKSWLVQFASSLFGEPDSKSQLLNIVRRGAERGLIDRNILAMLEGVFAVEETRVKDAMIPRSQMCGLELSSSLKDTVKRVTQSGHSRFPVMGANSSEVVGILLAKDLLPASFNDQPTAFHVRDLLRPAVFIPESKRLDALLQDFRTNRQHMAIVVDEYGSVTGLITIEDVLEQIVGDIEDEYDIDDSPQIQPNGEKIFSVKALTPLDDFNRYFNTLFDEKDIETIGGLVLRKIGHLPRRGECVSVEGFEFKITRADTRRIHQMQVTLPQANNGKELHP